MRVWLVVALGACTKYGVYAQPDSIARHADDFAARGYAHVEVDDGGTTTVHSDDEIAFTIPGNERSYAWGLVRTGVPDQTQQSSIGSFVAGCGPDGRAADCTAHRARGAIRVGTRRKLDPRGLAIGLFGALATIVGTACLATCSSSNGWAYVGTGIGAVTMLVPLSTVF